MAPPSLVSYPGIVVYLCLVKGIHSAVKVRGRVRTFCVKPPSLLPLRLHDPNPNSNPNPKPNPNPNPNSNPNSCSNPNPNSNPNSYSNPNPNSNPNSNSNPNCNSNPNPNPKLAFLTKCAFSQNVRTLPI